MALLKNLQISIPWEMIRRTDLNDDEQLCGFDSYSV
jgi:hypothetical protein